MATPAVTPSGAKAPPYLPLKTLIGALDALREGVPKRIDRGIWRSQSGAVQGQIMIALRFFDLLDEADAPTLPLLEQLAQADEAGRKKFLKPLVERHFHQVIAHDLTKMTPAMLTEEMEKFGVSGSTLRKAVTFFLQVAKYLELPLSPFLSDKTRTSPKTRRKSATRPAAAGAVVVPPPAPPSGSPGSSTKTVELRSGGQITVNVSGDIWNMNSADREFVLALIDQVRAYEEKEAPKKAAAKTEKAAAGQ